MIQAPPHIEKKFEELRSYWESIRSGQDVPLRADFRPEKIRTLLPQVTIDDYRSPDELISRLRGTDIVARFGIDLTGKNLTPLFDDGSRSTMMETARRVVETPCGARTSWTAERKDGRQVKVFAYYLPLIGGQGEKLFIGVSYETADKQWVHSDRKPVIAIAPDIEFFDLGHGLGQDLLGTMG